MIGVVQLGKPLAPKPGDMWMQDLIEVFTSWSSTDFGQRCDGHFEDAEFYCGPCEDWGCLLECKRLDVQYDDVRECIRDIGWVRPIVCYLTDDGQFLLGDGHHRLAAAVELHQTHVPVELKDWRENYYIAIDGFTWHLNMPIQPTNDSAGERAWHLACAEAPRF